MYANRTHANRPTRITAADRARQAAAIARHNKRQERERARERINRLIVIGCFIVAAVAGFYAASEPAPIDSRTYSAQAWDGSTIAAGLTMPDCLENYFNRPAVAGCTLED